MNRLVVALLAGVFAFGPASVCGEDEKQQATERVEPSKSAQTPKDKALKPQLLPTTKPLMGDFPQRRDRGLPPSGLPPNPPRPQPSSTEAERTERKRMVDEWEKTQQPAPK